MQMCMHQSLVWVLPKMQALDRESIQVSVHANVHASRVWVTRATCTCACIKSVGDKGNMHMCTHQTVGGKRDMQMCAHQSVGGKRDMQMCAHQSVGDEGDMQMCIRVFERM